MNAAMWLMLISFVLMLIIGAFIVRVNMLVQRAQREKAGDISHIRIPDDPSALTRRRHKPKPPYRPW